ncbi:MAG: SpoIIE family protein phosphatase [Pirellulales bacterium]
MEPPPRAPAFEELPGLGELCRTFSQATGWPLRFVRDVKPDHELLWSAPVCPGAEDPAGFLRIDLGNASSLDDLRRRVPLEAAERLAQTLGRRLKSEYELRRALVEREAELATAVPVIHRPEDSRRLAERLHTIVRSAAEALRCPAAALYVLDDATTELKLRSAWGLPAERLTLPARPLAAAVGDLEALLGNAVVLESPVVMGRWNVPEACRSAVVVPVSGPSMPFGTLWVFNDEARDYGLAEQNVLEIVAGRLAAELERMQLLEERRKSENTEKTLAKAAYHTFASGPSHAPPMPGWDIAGWSAQGAEFGGAFHDWLMLADGRIATMIGDACDGGLAGSLTSATLRGVLRNELERCGPAANYRGVIQRCHAALCALSCGNHWAGLLLTILDPRTGEVESFSSGRPLAVRVPGRYETPRGPSWSHDERDSPNDRPVNRHPEPRADFGRFNSAEAREEQRDLAVDRRMRPELEPRERKLILPTEVWTKSTTPLGIGETAETFATRKLLLPGDLLLGVNQGIMESRDAQGRPFDLTRLIGEHETLTTASADGVLQILRDNLFLRGYDVAARDTAALAIRRKTRG